MDNTNTSETQQETTEQISEVTPAQDKAQTTETKETTATSKEEQWEYDGNREKVPEQFKKYSVGFDRYLSKKDQALAEAKKQLQEYEAKLKELQTPKPSNTRTEESDAPLVTQEESEAIMLGDMATLEKIIERKAQKLIETKMMPQHTEIKTEVEALARERREREAATVISAFSDIHPDFQELLKSPVGEYMVSAARQGMDLETIYKNASQIRDHFFSQAEQKRKADLEAKKAGSVVGKSMPGTSDIVYAENADQQRRLALELTLKGDKRQVHIKPKK